MLDTSKTDKKDTEEKLVIWVQMAKMEWKLEGKISGNVSNQVAVGRLAMNVRLYRYFTVGCK